MQLKNLFTDEDAVSPVIGVILMVAITVILAAVIGAFVLGIGSSQEKAPQASWEWSYSGSPSSYTVTLAHDGGEDVDASALTLSSTGSLSDQTFSGTISAGEDLTSGTGVDDGATLTLTWQSSSGDSSQILSESTVPS